MAVILKMQPAVHSKSERRAILGDTSAYTYYIVIKILVEE